MFEQTQTAAPLRIHPMEYRAIVASDFSTSDAEAEAGPDPEELKARIRDLERDLEEQSRSFESALHAARIDAREAGRTSERTEHASRLAAAAQALAAALAEFKEDRDRYLSKVEQEIVRLALAIAARVLHREALMDPLLLAGAVRVALGQLAETTEVRLRVPASEHEMWRDMLRLMPNLPLHPEVISDDALNTGECLLETHLGCVDLGVRSQLGEIERGFFDLLEHRQPREKREPSPSMGSQVPQSA